MSNYSIDDIVEFFGLPEDYSETDIDTKANDLLEKYSYEDNKKQMDFIESMRTYLLEYLQDQPETISVNLPDTKEEPTDIYETPYSIGTVNPTRVNTLESLVCLDSRYCEFTNNDCEENYKSDYTINLSDKLHGVISISIANIYIPTTWYTLDPSIGNDIFIFNEVTYQIPAGNYTTQTLVTALNTLMEGVIVWGFDENKNKLIINEISESTDLTFVFYDTSISLGKSKYVTASRTLGWRTKTITLDYRPDATTTYTLPFSPSLEGTKHLILVVDDFKRNRHNGGMVGIDVTKTKLDIPEYVSRTFRPTNCDPDSNLIYARDQPIGLTIPQLYTLNEIASNLKEESKDLSPTPMDVMTIIPIYPITRPSPLVLHGGDISGGTRDYFGPVTISKLRMRLLDDSGTPVNLRGEDWVVTLNVKRLYQY